MDRGKKAGNGHNEDTMEQDDAHHYIEERVLERVVADLVIKHIQIFG